MPPQTLNISTMQHPIRLHIDEDAKKNEFIFPSDEYLDKCYVFSNVSDEVYSYMQEQFVKIQAD